jgi:hypothetical protein
MMSERDSFSMAKLRLGHLRLMTDQEDVDARVIPDQVGDRRSRMTMGEYRR